MRGFLVVWTLCATGISVLAQQPEREQPALRMGAGMTPPRIKHKVEPVFSSEARADHIQGTVILQLVVSPKGQPTHIEILVPLGYGLDEKATEAVGQWTFEPGTKDGLPVPVRATIEVNFRWAGAAFDDKYEHRRVTFTLALQKLRGKLPDPKNTAVDSMLELAKQDFPAALYVVGTWQMKGDKVPQDVEAGQAKFQKAADKNFGPAIYQVALRSIDDPTDSSKAWEKMRRASTLGSVEAQYFLGDRYERGDGVRQSTDEAKNHFRLCAAKGQPECQYRLAKLMFDSPNRQDYEYEQAVAWFQLAADNGVREARALIEREKPNLTLEQERNISTLARQFSSKAE